MAERRYLSCAETAKLIRKALKGKFPGQKFYVRSKTYAGGASINVKWMDGPTDKEVESLTRLYSGADFDGMIDMKTYNNSWLMPDGSTDIAHTPGSEMSGGVYPMIDNPKPHPKAELVHFGADFVFTERSYSVEFLEKVSEDFSAETGWDKVEIVESTMWVSDKNRIPSAYFGRTQETIPGGQHFQTLDREYNEAAAQTSAFVKPVVEKKAVKKKLPIVRNDSDWLEDTLYPMYDRDWTWIYFKEEPSEVVAKTLWKKLKAKWSKKRQAYFIKALVSPQIILDTVNEAKYHITV